MLHLDQWSNFSWIFPSCDAGTVLHAVLEEMPKWGVLQDVLTEIQEERSRLASSDSEAERQAAAAPVVVMAREAHTCAQLREVGRAVGTVGVRVIVGVGVRDRVRVRSMSGS